MNIHKIAPIFIGIVFVFVVCSWIFMGILIYKGSNEIAENGIGSIVHSLWCGKKVDCKIPGVEE